MKEFVYCIKTGYCEEVLEIISNSYRVKERKLLQTGININSWIEEREFKKYFAYVDAKDVGRINSNTDRHKKWLIEQTDPVTIPTRNNLYDEKIDNFTIFNNPSCITKLSK